jgi:uncharacterized protein YhfF
MFGLDALSKEYESYRSSTTGALQPRGPFVPKRALAQITPDDRVVIDAVAAEDPEQLKADLGALGAAVTAIAGRMVSARLPLGQISALDGVGSLAFARPAVAITNKGSVTSQGDQSMEADTARPNFFASGSGVIVGILSDSFDCSGNGSYATDQATGDLPTGVNVLDDTATDCSDEGRAMAQIVHDVAPGAGLAFHTAFNGEADFAQGIQDLAAAGADVIVDDVIYFAEPMLQDGVIAQAVDTVKDAGIAYFSAAGNSGRQAYEAPFDPCPFCGTIGTPHDFDPDPAVVDNRIALTQTGDTVYVLQWSDPFLSVSGVGASTDMDICFYAPPGAADPFWCEDSDSMGNDPVEVALITGSGTLEVSIERWDGPDPSLLKLVMFGSVQFDETYVGTSAGSIYGHANAAGADAIGASAYFLTPFFGEDPPVLNYYSSAGNTPILFDTDGNAISEVREKPEFTAPDGVNNTFFGFDYEPDGSPNFFGTSAAAPHAAAVAALMREVSSPPVTPDEITTALQDTAQDMLERETIAFGGPRVGIGAGFDNDSGAGLINALDAVNSVASPITPDLVGVWRPSTGRFYLDVDGSRTWTVGVDAITDSFGVPTDRAVAGDWNGDGADEIGVWRPSTGRFYLDVDGSRTWTVGIDVITDSFGVPTDVPVAGDWNGDGTDDIGVWRPSTGRFYLDADGSRTWTVGVDVITDAFGVAGDLPVAGDCNRDGVDEVAVWRPSTGRFYMDVDGSRTWSKAIDVITESFGIASDLPVVGRW